MGEYEIDRIPIESYIVPDNGEGHEDLEVFCGEGPFVIFGYEGAYWAVRFGTLEGKCKVPMYTREHLNGRHMTPRYAIHAFESYTGSLPGRVRVFHRGDYVGVLVEPTPGSDLWVHGVPREVVRPGREGYYILHYDGVVYQRAFPDDEAHTGPMRFPGLNTGLFLSSHVVERWRSLLSQGQSAEVLEELSAHLVNCENSRRHLHYLQNMNSYGLGDRVVYWSPVAAALADAQTLMKEWEMFDRRS